MHHYFEVAAFARRHDALAQFLAYWDGGPDIGHWFPRAAALDESPNRLRHLARAHDDFRRAHGERV